MSEPITIHVFAVPHVDLFKDIVSPQGFGHTVKLDVPDLGIEYGYDITYPTPTHHGGGGSISGIKNHRADLGDLATNLAQNIPFITANTGNTEFHLDFTPPPGHESGRALSEWEAGNFQRDYDKARTAPPTHTPSVSEICGGCQPNQDIKR